MTTPHEKGLILELAVHAIETAILRSSPSYDDKTFRIDNRKVIVVEGVRHEIDIWVTVDVAPGYVSTFIFECRNWKDKIGKNEIIVFSEKVRASNAQKGFFIAKSFTSDAEAQSKQDARIELLRATDLPDTDVPVPFDFHTIHVENLPANVDILFRDSTPALAQVIDLKRSQFVVDSQRVNLEEYVDDWYKAEMDQESSKFPSSTKPEGVYTLDIRSERQFSPGRAMIDGKPVISVTLAGKINIRVIRPTLISHFEVEKRGRALTYSVDAVVGTLKVAFAQLPIASD